MWLKYMDVVTHISRFARSGEYVLLEEGEYPCGCQEFELEEGMNDGSSERSNLMYWFTEGWRYSGFFLIHGYCVSGRAGVD